MKEIYRDSKYSLTQYSGHVEVIGPGEFTTSERSVGDIARKLDYIRLEEDSDKDKSSKVIMIKKLVTYDLVDSYLEPGISGTFWVLSGVKGDSPQTVIAAEVGGRFVEDFEALAKVMNWARKWFFTRAAIIGLVSVPLLLFVIPGLIGLAICILMIWAGVKMAPPNAEEMMKAIGLNRPERSYQAL